MSKKDWLQLIFIGLPVGLLVGAGVFMWMRQSPCMDGRPLVLHLLVDYV